MNVLGHVGSSAELASHRRVIFGIDASRTTGSIVGRSGVSLKRKGSALPVGDAEDSALSSCVVIPSGGDVGARKRLTRDSDVGDDDSVISGDPVMSGVTDSDDVQMDERGLDLLSNSSADGELQLPSSVAFVATGPATVCTSSSLSVLVPSTTSAALDEREHQVNLAANTSASLSLAVGPEGQLYAILPTSGAAVGLTSSENRRRALSLSTPSLSGNVGASAGLATGRSPTTGLIRDDRRRATHNEVERRRRDKINALIMKLADIIPDCPTSKSAILCKACDYVIELQDLLIRLQEKLTKVQGSDYERRIASLTAENQALRAVLERNGIIVPRAVEEEDTVS